MKSTTNLTLAIIASLISTLISTSVMADVIIGLSTDHDNFIVESRAGGTDDFVVSRLGGVEVPRIGISVKDGDNDGTSAGKLRFFEGTGGLETESVGIQAPAALAANWTMTLPVDAGTAGYILSTDGTGVTSWVAQ